jgi:hypothetical protein
MSQQTHVPPPPHRLLPPTTEHLSLICPSLSVIDSLNEVLDDDFLEFLWRVNLDCKYQRSDLQHVMSDMAGVWAGDRRIWFRLTISHPTSCGYNNWCRHQTWNVCEPHIIRVLKFLDNLYDVKDEKVCDVAELAGLMLSEALSSCCSRNSVEWARCICVATT